MAAMAVTHTAHAMNSSHAKFIDSSTTDALHPTSVPLAKSGGTLAVNATAFATNTVALPMSALCMDVLTVSVLSMQRSLG
jgi:hypothetical protein